MIEFDWKVYVFTILFIFGGFSFAFLIRDMTYKHAFRGMSKTKKRKIVRSQSKLNYILMTYTLKYDSSIRTWWCLIFYWAFLICNPSMICLVWVSIFVEVPIPSVALTIIMALAGLSPAFVAISFLLPIKPRAKGKRTKHK